MEGGRINAIRMTPDYSESLNAISRTLILRGETLAVAESVTSGNLQAAFSLAENASKFFQGGVTGYNFQQHVNVLGVETTLTTFNDGVSKMVADQMARSVAAMFQANWGIAIIGHHPAEQLTAPGEKLFAYYAMVIDNALISERRMEIIRLPVQRVQERYVSVVLDKLADMLIKAH